MAVTPIKGNKKPKRGDPCPCGSTLKHRDCHGSGEKQRLCNEMVRQYMLSLIVEEMIKKGIMCEHGVKAGEKCVDCMGPQELKLKGENDEV